MEPSSSSPRWLSDLVKDDISISHPYDEEYDMMLHSLEDYTLNDDLNFHTTTTPDHSVSPTSKIISFGGADATDHHRDDEHVIKPKKKEVEFEQLANNTVQIINSNNSANNTVGRAVMSSSSSRALSIRTPFYAKEHVIAERKRREKITQCFIALSAVLPNLKKMDKASVLGEAAKYVKHLQERVKILESSVAAKKSSVVLVNKSHHAISGDDNLSSSDETSGFQTNDKHQLPEVEARVSQKLVLIRVHCERRPSCTAKILHLIEKMKLSVVNNSVVSFGTSLLDITVVAQMEVEFNMTIEELVKNLRQDLINLM